MMLKPKLIPEWKRAYKFASVQLSAFGASAALAWNAVPEDMRKAVPHWVLVTSAGVLFVLILLSRLVDQPKQRGDQ